MRNTDLGWAWGGRGGVERTNGRLETEEGWARERGRFRNHPQSSLWEAPNVGRWGSWGGSYRESEGQCQDWATARLPAPSIEPELFMAQKRQLELFLSKLLQATCLLFISSSPCPLSFLSESPFRGQAITPHQCDLYAAVTCRLSPAPSVLISAFFLLFPPNFSTSSTTLLFYLVKDRSPSVRTHTPLCHTSFKYLYHLAVGKNSNWWYFHLFSLSAPFGEWWRFQIAHYLFSTQAQVVFQQRPYRTQTFHNPIMFYEQFYNQDVILSCPSERWLYELSGSSSWNTEKSLRQFDSEFIVLSWGEPFAQEPLCGGASAVAQSSH